jgi:hypothetical protein
MDRAFDLFSEDENGKPIFLVTAIGLDQVEDLLTKLTAARPGKYQIYDPTEAQFVVPFKKSAHSSQRGDATGESQNDSSNAADLRRHSSK